MKKVLIISYFFPPQPDIGAQRPYRIAKYLSKLGWHPVVLTAKHSGSRPSGLDIIETDYDDVVNMIKAKIGFSDKKGVHEQVGIEASKNYQHVSWKSRLIKNIKDVVAFPDEQKGWLTHAVKSASDILSKENFDVILSTSYPVTAHLIARKLKQRFHIPWIADFRDPWTQNPYVNKSQAITYFEKRLELKTIADADRIVAVTKFWTEKLDAMHHNKKALYIPNGYDKEDYAALPTQLTKKFSITYTGILYNGKRDPSMLFNVLGQLINENIVEKDLLDVRFYGPKESWVHDEAVKFNLDGVVTMHGPVPRDVALQKQRESHLLLLLLWDNKNEEGFCPGKIYEYFAVNRPIIAIGGKQSVVKNLISETNTGYYADNPSSLKRFIAEKYREFKDGGEVKKNTDSHVEDYAYTSIATQYAKVLDEVCRP